jgi:hypothetical protein
VALSSVCRNRSLPQLELPQTTAGYEVAFDGLASRIGHQRSALRFVAISWALYGQIGHIVGSADGPGLVPQGILVDVTGI